MERTVPEIASEEIELYLRTVYSLLRASTEVRLRSLEEAHAGMNSLLHPLARQKEVDVGAFVYSALRLPAEITSVEYVILGQSDENFTKHGIPDVNDWREVTAPARRRRCYYDGKDTLACLISSRSDIDDLVPILTAYQIEWNKLNELIRNFAGRFDLKAAEEDGSLVFFVAEMLNLEPEDIERLISIWGPLFFENINLLSRKRMDVKIRLLDGSLSEYRRAIHRWWTQIESVNSDLRKRAVYFVSSNTHSLVNLATGFALEHAEELVYYLVNSGDQDLREEWKKIQADEVPSSRENFLYYLLKKVHRTPLGDELEKVRAEYEAQCGVRRTKSRHNFDLESQVIPLNCIDPEKMDPRLREAYHPAMKDSQAVIINIDYPLGLAAYQVLSEIAENVSKVLGIYIIGKAATLNGVVGDVMIPNVVYDGQSRNSYLFANCFRGHDVSPYLVYGTALDNQKAVSVQGTFLQNHEYMDVFYREGYTDIEMEGGPYLSAIYEMTRPIRHPVNEVVSLYDIPFDLGVLHYASDKPLSKGKNLGAANLSYFGMDPTYATGVAVLKRIFQMEANRLGQQKDDPGASLAQ
ncbi:hypothetical protein KQH61_05790 [bacterium]|nr:hypothetical protein [bacterium]MCB2179415.1 hypothetical protein [bacterium]